MTPGRPAPGAAAGPPWRAPIAIHALAAFAALWTFALLFVGGLVTSREAGLAVPDWPLSYGRIHPPDWTESPNILVEHGHRLLGWGLGIQAILLAVLVQLREPRRGVRVFAWSVLGAIAVQGVLGGYFRVVLLQHYMAAVHGVLGQGVFCAMVALALLTSRGWREAPAPEPRAGAVRARRLALAAGTAVYLQVVLGAILRHSRAGHEIAAVAPHAAWGIVVAGLAGAASTEVLSRHGTLPALVRPALLLGAGAVLQVLLGLGAYFANVRGAEEIVRPPLQFWTATAHQAAGALVLASAVVLYLRLIHLTRPAPAPAGEAGGRGLPAGGAA